MIPQTEQKLSFGGQIHGILSFDLLLWWRIGIWFGGKGQLTSHEHSETQKELK